MEILAIIPARGGSRGIPRKNVLPLAGKPLIAYTIENARHAATVSRVVVSTDDPEIGAVSLHFGAEVVWRPAEISGDQASSEAALLYTLDSLKEIEGYQPDLVVFLQCTSPLTLPEDIDAAVQVLRDENADCALTVTPFYHFLWRRDDNGSAVGINHNILERPMRQERESQFLETGAVYVMRTQGFHAAKHRFFGKTAMSVMPPERSIEIDEPKDFIIAAGLMRERLQRRPLLQLPPQIAALVLDFDGVFTDNRVLVHQGGGESVLCHRGDGLGLEQLGRLGVPILVLSTEKNPVVQVRCDKLQIPCVHGIKDKTAVLFNWIKEKQLDPSQVIFVGNDVNDLDCLRAVGCPVVVNDAHPQAKAVARIILNAPGGYGAIRELTDLVAKKLEEQKNATSC
jgi:N-acylneuraminate cytidylyltransferase